MGFLDKLRGELVDIIEWIDDSRTTLAWRFPRYNNEIKNGAQLIVREGQEAVFVYRGQLADRFKPGAYTLTTEAIPILSTLQGWKHGFESPFRSEVYFINTRPVTELRWGTPQPVTIRDPDFQMVPVRANGLCVIRIADAEIFLKQVIGTDSSVELEELTELVRRLISTVFADMLASSTEGVLALQSKNAEFAARLRDVVAEQIDDEYGLAVESIAMNMSLPEEITAAITAGVAKGMETRGYVGNVGDVGRLQQVRAADATLAAAANEGGGAAGAMVGAGVGMALGAQVGNQMAANQGAGGATPPPLIGGALFHVAGNGQATGPYTQAQLEAAVSAGTLLSSTLVWTAGMTTWAQAGTVPALTGLFAPPPPPPPPADPNGPPPSVPPATP